MFGRRKNDQPNQSQDGAYRIKLSIYKTSLAGNNSHWWQWEVFDTNGKCLARDQVVGRIDERHREEARKDAKRWIDSKIERDRLLAEAEVCEEWYGTTPEVMQKTITTQESYIQQLEAKLDEFRRPDGYLDADAMVDLKEAV
jgi:hypothetical protein